MYLKSAELTVGGDVARVLALGVSEVFIPHRPKDSRAQVVKTASLAQKYGFRVVVHVPVGRFEHGRTLGAHLDALYAVGVQAVCVLLGDCPIQGGFDSTLAALRLDIWRRFFVWVVAHPDGIPHVAREMLDQALCAKSQYAGGVLTQWSLNAEAIVALSRKVTLPIRVGGITGLSFQQSLTWAKRLNLIEVQQALLLRAEQNTVGHLQGTGWNDYFGFLETACIQHVVEGLHLFALA